MKLRSLEVWSENNKYFALFPDGQIAEYSSHDGTKLLGLIRKRATVREAVLHTTTPAWEHAMNRAYGRINEMQAEEIAKIIGVN